MSNPIKNQHVDPSGTILPEGHSIPANQGKTPRRSVADTALAILEGRPLTPDLPWCELDDTRARWAEKLAKRAENPSDTLDLTPYFPDWEIPLDEHVDEEFLLNNEEYNSLTTTERAISEVFMQIYTDGYISDIQNPIFIYELQQAAFRTLERLLNRADALHSVEVEA